MSVRPGERRAVLGSNGAGKTTLFNCVTGDFLPTSGTIRLFGEDLTNFPAHERIRRGLRRTYQISLLFGGMSVADNVYLACLGVSRGRFSLLRPRPSDAIVARAAELIEAVHLTRVRDTPVSSLSYGQQRQLEIALALAGAPRFILFDEPAAGLSPAERADLVAILSGLPDHIGYIIIEHDMDVALRVAESVTMLHNGRVFKEGTPEEIENDAEVQELYLGGGPWLIAAARRPSRSARSMCTTAHRMRCRASTSASRAACCPSSAATAWARPRSARPSWAWCRSPPVRSASPGSLSSASRRPTSPSSASGMCRRAGGCGRSLTVDEHLRLMDGRRKGAWTIDRVYATFPRLAERKSNGGGQLSGGEQQMLAISRALLANPRLLVMDEPTEGLAPVIVAQVEEMLQQLGEEGDMDVLVIEQNIGVACTIAENVAIMVNGRINRILAAQRAGKRPRIAATPAGCRPARPRGYRAGGRRRQPAASAGSAGAGTGPDASIYKSNPKLPTRWSQPVPVAADRGAGPRRHDPASSRRCQQRRDPAACRPPAAAGTCSLPERWTRRATSCASCAT